MTVQDKLHLSCRIRALKVQVGVTGECGVAVSDLGKDGGIEKWGVAHREQPGSSVTCSGPIFNGSLDMIQGLARFNDKRRTGGSQHYFSCSTIKEGIADNLLQLADLPT
jgi:hypothetical protein